MKNPNLADQNLTASLNKAPKTYEKKIKITKKYVLLDSAGIRKPGSRTSGAETFATFHTIEAAHQADVICLVVDGSAPLTHQDQVVAGICKEAKKGVVVIANKADLVDKMGRKLFEESFYKKFSFLKVQKFLWVSAKAEILNNHSKSPIQSGDTGSEKMAISNLTTNFNKSQVVDSMDNSSSNIENKAAVKKSKKSQLSEKNIAKMQADFAKNLPQEPLGQFLPENGLSSIWRSIDAALESRQKDLDPEQVRKLFNYLMKHKDKRPVKLSMQKKPIVYDLLYTKNSPPTFELLVKDKAAIHWSYLRFLENVVRSQFGLKNTGIVIKVVEVKKSKVMT